MLYFIPLCSFAQRNKKIEIQKITITNSYVVDAIKQLIDDSNKDNKLFEDGFGYIVLDGISFRNYTTMSDKTPNSGKWTDTLTSFNVHLGSAYLGSSDPECFQCDYFPTYYTYIDGRLVLVYDDAFRWLTPRKQRLRIEKKYTDEVFSDKSVKKLSKIVNQTLQQTLDTSFVFYNPFEDRSYKLDKRQRKNISKAKLLSSASFTYKKNSYNVFILRNGAITVRKD